MRIKIKILRKMIRVMLCILLKALIRLEKMKKIILLIIQVLLRRDKWSHLRLAIQK